jgi:asparagine synthase (glutamine-hydrolysing)
MSMAHGLEVRVPLIDHRLAEQAMRLPGTWKINKAEPKPLLVGALRGALPDSIVHRPKRGFTLPFERWVRQALRPDVEGALRMIQNGPLGGELSAEAARAVWNDFESGKTSWTRPWALFVAQRWCEQNL